MDFKNILNTFNKLTEGSMKSAEKHSTGPKFVGKAGPMDTAAQAKKKLVGSNESVLKELEAELNKPASEVKRNLAEEFKLFKEGTALVNTQDIIKLDVPLLIRLLEYAREDAQDDMDLHNVAEKLIAMSTGGDVIGMDHYDEIISTEQIDEYGGVGGTGAASQAPQGTTSQLKSPSPADQQAKLDAAQIKKSTQQLQPTLNAQGAAQNLNPVKFGDVMNKLDTQPNTQLSNQEQNQLAPMAVATSKVLQNPQTASQMKQLITKADQIEKAKADKLAQQQKSAGVTPTTTTTPSAGTTE